MDARAPASQNAALRLDKSLLRQGIEEDPAAIETMFRQFIPPGERVLNASYLGCLGTYYYPRLEAFVRSDVPSMIAAVSFCLLLTLTIGVFQQAHCFGLVTERRVATIRSGLFGEVLYQDAFLEHINYSRVQQPSSFGLYAMYAGIALCAAGGLLAPLVFPGSWYARLFSGPAGMVLTIGVLLAGGLFALYLKFLFHLFVKSGVVFGTTKGMPVSMFTDRKRLFVANRIQRTLSEYREHRRAMASTWRLSH